jgi:hypothetical protein
MSVPLAAGPIILDTVINKVVQEGDSVHRIGTDEALETFQGLVHGDPFMAWINGRERTMAEYRLQVSVMCVCGCVFTWADGQANHFQACPLDPYEHY